MRPLPRLHAVTDAATLALDDLGIRAAAIASAGSAVALHARDRQASAAALAGAAARFVALAAPAEAAVIVSGRADIAAALGAHGVQLRASDLLPTDARRVLAAGPAHRSGWVGCSVHSAAGAETAVREGADFLLVGSVYATASHPGQMGGGLELVRITSRLGVPVIAIGGVTSERVAELRDAGAYGVAAIRALWGAADPAQAALALLRPWTADA